MTSNGIFEACLEYNEETDMIREIKNNRCNQPEIIVFFDSN